MTSFHLAGAGEPTPWEPFASSVARLWSGMDASALALGEHISFWFYFGAILLFLPYFPYSKHIHMLFAPLNFALKPERRSIGQLGYLNLEDQSIEQFGAAKMKDLGWEQVLDSYACIMCFRCQEVCPAYNTGKLLSPAALEINKRYHLNYGGALDVEMKTLISEEAVWACTSCGACVDICPVNNEPMRDILEMRRNLSMMESAFPKQLETAFKGMERNLNPWNVSQADRMKWAEGLAVPTIEQNPAPDILWWVGCAPATDARAQKTAQAFAQILNAAGVELCRARQERSLHRRLGAPRRARGYLLRARHAERRALERGRAQTHRHHLPALPAHPPQRVPRLRWKLRGHPPHPAHQ